MYKNSVDPFYVRSIPKMSHSVANISLYYVKKSKSGSDISYSWIVDSGCKKDMTFDGSVFSHYQEIP